MSELLSDDPGSVGGYTIAGRLGENASGVLYLATLDDETVALRLLTTPVDSAAGARFLQSAQLAMFVAGQHIARVLDAGLMADRPYLVSEFIPAQPRETDGPLDREELEKLATGTLSALASIHRSGIIHGAFHPGNVLVGADGVKVTDFGQIAAHPAEGFMAPEQSSGQWLWASADLYSWAATMIYAATGQAPGQGSTDSKVRRRGAGADARLRQIPMPLRDLLASCLATDPATRPTAEAALQVLAGGVAAPTPAKPAPVPGKQRATRVLALAGVLSVLVAVPVYALTAMAKPAPRPGKAAPPLPAAPPSSDETAEPAPPGSPSTSESPIPVPTATVSVSLRPSVKPSKTPTQPASPTPPGIGCAGYSKNYPVEQGGQPAGRVEVISVTVCIDRIFGKARSVDTAPGNGWEVCVGFNGHIAGTSSGNDGTYVGTAAISSRVSGEQSFNITPGAGRTFDFVYVNLANCQTTGDFVWDWKYSDRLNTA